MKKPEPMLRQRGRPAADTAHAVPEDRVLGLAFRAFAQHGYGGTTLRALAKQLGVSHNLLNVRFGTKEELWKRAVDAQIVLARLPVYAAFDAPDLDAEARLRQLILRFCRWAADNPELVGLTNVECRHASWRLDYLVDAYILPFKQRLDALMAAVAATRPVHRLPTSALMSLLVQGVGSYFASAPMLERAGVATEIAPEHVDAQVRMFADFILAALLPP